jgi:hypothetical protein
MVTACVWLLPPLFAFLWCEVLTRPGELFGWWAELVNKVFKLDGKMKRDYNVLQNIAFHWFYGCAKCMAGLLSVVLVFVWPPEDVLQGIARVTAAILLAFWLTQRYETGRL